MRFSEFIFKNLLRRKTRSLLTAAGLAAAVGSMTALFSMAWSLAAAGNAYYRARGVDLVVVRAGVAERITSSLGATLADRLQAQPEVAEVDGTLTEMVSLGTGSLIGIPLRGVEPAGFAHGSLTIGSGRGLTTADRRCVLLGNNLARALGQKAGRKVDIEGTEFQVVGTFDTENPIESNTAITRLNDVQTLMDRAGQVSEFQVRVKPACAGAGQLDRLCRRIEALGDEHGQSLGFKALPTRQFVENDTETRLASAMAWGTSGIAGVLSLLGMLNTMLMSVLERTKELGIVRAVGWTRLRVVRLIVGEALVVTAAAAVLGIALAALVVRVLSGWSFTQSFVQPTLMPAALALGVGLTLGAGVLGSLYPAYVGAGLLPTHAFRCE